MKVDIELITEDSELPFTRRNHVCIPIDPYNFQAQGERFCDLVKWCLQNFSFFHFFLNPLSLNKADADKRENSFKKVFFEVLRNNGIYSEPEKFLLENDFLDSNDVFQQELEEAYRFFDTDEDFRNECLEATNERLGRTAKFLSQSDIFKATKGMMRELPILAAANKIVEAPSSMCLLQDVLPFHERLHRGLLTYGPAFGQGLAKISY